MLAMLKGYLQRFETYLYIREMVASLATVRKQFYGGVITLHSAGPGPQARQEQQRPPEAKTAAERRANELLRAQYRCSQQVLHLQTVHLSRRWR